MRSLKDSTHALMTVGDYQYFIEPEHLNTREIQHELWIRMEMGIDAH